MDEKDKVMCPFLSVFWDSWIIRHRFEGKSAHARSGPRCLAVAAGELERDVR